MNYYKRFPGDYLRDTVHLSMIEDGAYNRLLDWCYTNERPIPKVDLYRISRAQTKSERDAVDKVVADFFHREGDGFVQGRAKEAIVKRQQAAEVHRDAGRMGGRPENQNSIQNDNQTGNQNGPGKETKQAHMERSIPSSHQATKPSKGKIKSLAAAPPAWIDATLWEHWRDERKSMKAPMTPHAEALLFVKLEAMRTEGHDVRAVIEQSIERRWKGFFPIKSDAKNGHSGSGFESRIAEQERVIGSLTGSGKTGSGKGRTIEPAD